VNDIKKKLMIGRRSFLKGSAAVTTSLAAPSFFVQNAWAADFVNDPGHSKSVTFGFNYPQTGVYADEGADEIRAYKLAVKHLNGEGDGGLLNTMKPLSLKGNGVLGKKVEFVTGDTQSSADAGRRAAKYMIQNEAALMITGGSSSATAIAVQSLCQDSGVVFMAGLSHSNDTTGKNKSRYGFRHFFNAHMSGAAMGPVLKEELGTDRRAYHLTSDYTWGWTQEESMRNTTEALGWETVNTIKTPLNTADFSTFISPVLNSGADVLVLNHYGRDMINSLSQAVQLGLRDMQVNGKQFEIIVPLFSRVMAQGAGDSIKGILGTANWNWGLQDIGSQAFVKSFSQEYGFPPSQAAHTCYVQTLLYANAAEMAGTFYPPVLIKTLEGFQFDGTGNGQTLYRAQDHQCFKDVLVVRGNVNPSSPFDLLEIVKEVPAEQVTYDANLFGGELGPYKV